MRTMSRSIGKWKLPQPTDIKEDNEWIPIPRIARTVPFGYKQDDEDPDQDQPDPHVRDDEELIELLRRGESIQGDLAIDAS